MDALEVIEQSVEEGDLLGGATHCQDLIKDLDKRHAKDSGDVPAASKTLLHSATGQCAYLLALSLLQQGYDAAADRLLGALGCTTRLSSLVLQASAQHCQSDVGSQDTSSNQAVTSVKGGLSDRLCAALAACFASNSAYWDAHKREGGTPFFSYMCPLDTGPSNLVAVAVHAAHAAMLRSPCSAHRQAAKQARAVEWWAHSRRPHEPHQLHFDADECLMRQGLSTYRLRHPAATCILFLTDAQDAGPTIILDQTASQDLAHRGWLLHPTANQAVVFPGDLLHGVLPGKPRGVATNDSASEPSAQQRITLMMAFWAEPPCPPAHGGGHPPADYLGPAMTFPPVPCPASTQAGAEDEREPDSSHAASGAAMPGAAAASHDKHMDHVSSACDHPASTLGGELPLPELNFFLRSRHALRQQYIPDAG
ncbi:hypothetical protein WJX73_002259 [Symbiochloris irregularis]|uniref:Fe2OG dioxygenase domain-containing protein n=1 Tax=Symbiochloris irregularis TaxID=706552 RepID=A0AAW1PCE5_9CHLO